MKNKVYEIEVRKQLNIDIQKDIVSGFALRDKTLHQYSDLSPIWLGPGCDVLGYTKKENFNRA